MSPISESGFVTVISLIPGMMFKKQDEEYLEASTKEAELCSRFESLDLPKEQKETIKQWEEIIHAQNAPTP